MASVIVSPSWLDGEIKAGNNDIRIFDTSPAMDDYVENIFKSSHIEGAQHLNIFVGTNPTKEIPFNIPDCGALQDYLRSLGVNGSSHVVLYENLDRPAASNARMWWILRTYGVKNVSVLDGGLKRWKSEGYPVTDQLKPFPAGDVTLTVNKQRMVTYDQVLAAATGAQLVDTRLPENYSGAETEPSKYMLTFLPMAAGSDYHFQTGHIPGALNVPYIDLFLPDGSFKPRDQLLQVFKEKGVNVEGQLTSTCYVGFTACYLALTAAHCQLNDVSVYYGSWVEYGQRAPVNKVERTAHPDK